MATTQLSKKSFVHFRNEMAKREDYFVIVSNETCAICNVFCAIHQQVLSSCDIHPNQLLCLADAWYNQLADAERVKVDRQIRAESTSCVNLSKRTTVEDPLQDRSFPTFLASRVADPKIRKIFHMRLIEDMNRLDIAERLKCTTQTIGSMIQKWSRKDNGLSFEVYFKELIGDPRGTEKRSGPTEVDCIGADGEIYSLKSIYRIYNLETFNPLKHLRPEWNEALKRNTTFHLVVTRPELWQGRLVSVEVDPRKPPRSFSIDLQGNVHYAGEKA